ncbi:carbohydrate kinase family protein [Psychroserpens damuponensis]|uniref:carbohydrate kinase family protein n=1 Tax=Psychroserpens damuponensis TaxID=943936 RepID=UPI0005911184|nr:carbohydrate kinase [Psychroserpens damuponensis]
MKNIVCFGEVLWDVFPTHKKIGGAPLNVALRLRSLGNNISLISKVGSDANGRNIVFHVVDHDINTESLQIDNTTKTGVVEVTLDHTGSASYVIETPVAWDNIELTETAIKATQNADAFIYGSLVTRNSISKQTLYTLLNSAKYKIFDVNLRAPFYATEILNHLMLEADFIKFNDDEIFEICQTLGFNSQIIEENIKFIADRTKTKSICVTKGSKGAVLYVDGGFYWNSGYTVKVIDTVGAGDSFLATLIHMILKENTPQEALDYACAVGALVAGSEGANPEIHKKDIARFLKPNY